MLIITFIIMILVCYEATCGAAQGKGTPVPAINKGLMKAIFQGTVSEFKAENKTANSSTGRSVNSPTLAQRRKSPEAEKRIHRDNQIIFEKRRRKKMINPALAAD